MARLICNTKNDRSSKKTLTFFLFTSKLIRFWILHSNWVRLNLFISCFIMVCLHGKVIVMIASQMLWLPLQWIFVTKFHVTQNVSRTFFFSLQYHLLFLEQGKKITQKFINFDSGNYMNMWVTFDFFTCNRVSELKIPSKRSELPCNN